MENTQVLPGAQELPEGLGKCLGAWGTARAPTALHPGAHENVYGRCLVGLEIPFLPLPKGCLLIPSSGRREGKGKCDQKSIWKHAAVCL